jgi:hypothetical protein
MWRAGEIWVRPMSTALLHRADLDPASGKAACAVWCLRTASERFIAYLCRDHRLKRADQLLAKVYTMRTGLIQREAVAPLKQDSFCLSINKKPTSCPARDASGQRSRAKNKWTWIMSGVIKWRSCARERTIGPGNRRIATRASCHSRRLRKGKPIAGKMSPLDNEPSGRSCGFPPVPRLVGRSRIRHEKRPFQSCELAR